MAVLGIWDWNICHSSGRYSSVDEHFMKSVRHLALQAKDSGAVFTNQLRDMNPKPPVIFIRSNKLPTVPCSILSGTYRS